jgi:GNAT superfamily N-acetyltransferase
MTLLARYEETMDITYSDSLPDSCASAVLFDSTGWFRHASLDIEALDQALAQSWTTLSAYDHQLLVGFGRVISDGVLHGFIVDLIVLPSYQGHGIGSHILEQLVTRCRDVGIRTIQLFAANGKAGFYERHSFVPRHPDAPGMELPRL